MSDLEPIGFSAEEVMLIVKALSALNNLTDDDDELDLITSVLEKIINSIEAD